MRAQTAQTPLTDRWIFRNIRLVGTVVGIAVVALAALVFVTLIYKSPQDRYLEEQNIIRLAVVGYYSGFHPDVPREMADWTQLSYSDQYLRYATHGLRYAGLANALPLADVGNGEIAAMGAESNPAGNYQDQSRMPQWEDVDGDRVRDTVGEKLFYENASPAPTVDHWNTITVLQTDTDTQYVIDSRHYFIDMQRLLETFYLKKLPASASPDNHVDGKGSYSWYVDKDGEVRSLLYTRPLPTSVGFNDVYP